MDLYESVKRAGQFDPGSLVVPLAVVEQVLHGLLIGKLRMPCPCPSCANDEAAPFAMGDYPPAGPLDFTPGVGFSV